MNATTIRASREITLAATVMMMLACPTAYAAGTPAQKCEAGKNSAAGKYTACIEKAQSGFVVSGDAVKYDADVTKCDGKLLAGWTKAESAGGLDCPTTGDEAAIGDFLDACTDSVAVALHGGALPSDVVTCNAELAVCDDDLATCGSTLAACGSDLTDTQSDLVACDGDLAACTATLPPLRFPKTGQITCYNDAGSPVACAGSGQDGQLQAGSTPSYTDNGNGTITDNVTKLMWEKLSDDGSIHDKDSTYFGMSAGIAKANTLNGAAFAGHTDWRLPNRRELASIVDLGRQNPSANPVFHTGCVGGCTILSCSCTKNTIYWTSSTYIGYSLASWKVIFQDGDIYAGNRAGESHAARVVRNVN